MSIVRIATGTIRADVIGHPGAELVGLLPGEESRLALLGPGDPDAIDRRVDRLAALLSRAEDPLQQRERHLRPARRSLGDRGDQVLDQRAADPLDRERRRAARAASGSRAPE